MARFAILTLSDRGAAGDREDLSGERIAQRVLAAAHTVTARTLLPDDRAAIASCLQAWADENIADVIVTTGGTGLTERDVTPEATRDIAERDVPGVAVAILLEGLKKTPFAALSRGVAVTRARALIVNLPGNPRAIDDGMNVVLPLADHVRQLLAGPVEHGS